MRGPRSECVRLATMSLALLAGFVLPQSFAAAGDHRVAVVDTSADTRDHLDKLQKAGVKVIGRYFARCSQPEIPGLEGKRLIDNVRATESTNKREVDTILDHPGQFAVLSIYQYYNNNALKFSGMRPSGEKTAALKDPTCQAEAVPPHTPENEGKLDGEAAVAQAKEVGQPPGTTIFFGVDFDYDPNDSLTSSNMNAYFTAVADVVGTAGYVMGAYGNGGALKQLSQAGLVAATWLNPSRGHRGSVEYFNEKSWDLFQSRIALKFVKSPKRWLVVDTNIENPARPGKSALYWRRDGPLDLASDRADEVFASRRFVCDGLALIRDRHGNRKDGVACGRRTDNGRAILDCDEIRDQKTGEFFFDHRYPKPDERSRLCFGDVVRVGRAEGSFIEIDCNEDGIMDGWTRAANLGSGFDRRPAWISDRITRRAVTRATSGCLQTKR